MIGLIAKPDKGKTTHFGFPEEIVVRTTVGRVLFNTIWPEQLGFFNKPALKGDLGDLILGNLSLNGKGKIP